MFLEQLNDEDLYTRMTEKSRTSDQMGERIFAPPVIRAVHQSWPPLFYRPNDTGSETYSGYNFEVFETICASLGVKIEYIASRYRGVWAWKNPANGTWIGMLRMLVDDEADACIAGAAMTPERTEISDFTFATTHFASTIFVQTPSRKQANIDNNFVCLFTERVGPD